ncbi:MAG: hypothetical protein PHR06_15960 [Candidatus Cloacimonetes bacterium]|nr:hypothetical protein [Candidatus Cloacimonadota bacterium]
MVVSDYYGSGESHKSIALKYDLSCPGLVLNWLKRFPIDSELVSLPSEVKDTYMKNKADPTEEEILQNRICELEKALAYANLRAHALDVLIDIAEKKEGISIRKKAGVKQ